MIRFSPCGRKKLSKNLEFDEFHLILRPETLKPDAFDGAMMSNRHQGLGFVID